MNLKSINSKLDFLENLIVEMNPENLEELKNLCFEKISEIISDLIINERASEIYKTTHLNVSQSIYLAEKEQELEVVSGKHIDLVNICVKSPVPGISISFLQAIACGKNAMSDIHPKIGEELKLEFEKPKVVYDKPESKYFTKPKNNFKKR